MHVSIGQMNHRLSLFIHIYRERHVYIYTGLSEDTMQLDVRNVLQTLKLFFQAAVLI